MDIQVGDRITYKCMEQDPETFEIVINKEKIDVFMYAIQEGHIKILKIERPKYEVVEERKELLTEEEKEFLKRFINFNDIEEIYNIRRGEENIFIHDSNNRALAIFKISNLHFKNLEKYKEYTLKELGLEEN